MGWPVKKLKEVCRLINGRAYKKTEMLKEGPYPLLRVGNFFSNRNWYFSDLELDEDKYCDGGDLLYAWSASFGPRIWDGGKVIYHYHIWKIEVNEALIDKHFLYYLLEWDKELIKNEQGAGTTMIHVTKASMENRELPIPPVPEQKRIVTMLDEAFADIDKARELTQQNLKNARELFVCYLKQAFEHSNNKVIYQLLDNIAKFSGGGTPSKKESSFWIGDIPWVSPKDMKSEIIFDSIDHISKRAIENSSASLVRRGAILVVVRSGILARTIPIAMAGNDLTVNQDLKVISAKRGIVPDYLYFFLKAKESYLLDKVTRGATVHRLSTDTLKKLKIPVLSEKEQTNIAEKCAQLKLEVERVVAIYETKLDYLNELRNSLLANAFSGKLNIT